MDIVWADEDGEFMLSDGSYGNPGCDCGMDDAVVKINGEYFCQEAVDSIGITR